MMQCSSAAAQIQYSRHRIFFGFEDEIAGGKSSLRRGPETAKTVAAGDRLDKARKISNLSSMPIVRR
jgi:hypothetical protein